MEFSLKAPMPRPILNKARLHPVSISTLIRVGPLEDGGYIVPREVIGGTRLLLSLGLSENWDFDREFLKLNPNATIIGVDHTVGPETFRRGRFRCLWKILGYGILFRRKKLAEYTKRYRDFRDYDRFFSAPHRHLRRRVSHELKDPVDIRFEDILKHGPTGGIHDVFLKMDIEGSEYEIVDDILAHQSRISCIATEFHELHTRTEEFNEAVGRLLREFVIVHVHGNNCGPYHTELDFPEALELTFLNRRLAGNNPTPSTATYPIAGLDYPNNPKRPDYPLRFGTTG